MNITDIQEPSVIPITWEAIVRAIFDRQEQLMEKYREIEGLPRHPLLVDLAESQAVIKDFAWRTVEELTESYEAWIKHGDDDEVAESHSLEELADAVHFYVELLIFAGVTPDDVLEYTEGASFMAIARARPREETYWWATFNIGVAMNFLRNKPWKQHQVPTDMIRFRRALLEAFYSVVLCFGNQGYNEETLYRFYFKKSEVNKFRQRSNY